MRLKIEVLAPMPSAMEMMASAAKPGFLRSWQSRTEPAAPVNALGYERLT